MPLATSLRSENDARDITQPPMAHQQRSISPSIVIVNDPPPSQELRRSESSPQVLKQKTNIRHYYSSRNAN